MLADFCIFIARHYLFREELLRARGEIFVASDRQFLVQPAQTVKVITVVCSLMLRAAPAPHTQTLSALQMPTFFFTVLSVKSEWSALSLS